MNTPANAPSSGSPEAKTAGQTRQTATGHQPLVDAPPSADSPRWVNTLLDGTQVTVRPIRPQDKGMERNFIEHMSAEARRFRFLGTISDPSESLLRSLTELDFRRDAAFVALVRCGAEQQAVGIGRFSLSADGSSCECAVAVANASQKKGIGTLLMRHLIDVARGRGVRTMISIDAADNVAMHELATFLGFRREPEERDSTEVIHSLTL